MGLTHVFFRDIQGGLNHREGTGRELHHSSLGYIHREAGPQPKRENVRMSGEGMRPSLRWSKKTLLADSSAVNSPFPIYPTSLLRPHVAIFTPVATLEEILLPSRDKKTKIHIQSFAKPTNAGNQSESKSPGLTWRRHQILWACLNLLQDDSLQGNFYRNFIWQPILLRPSMYLPVNITRGNKKTIESLCAPRFFTFLCLTRCFNVPEMRVSLFISVS